MRLTETIFTEEIPESSIDEDSGVISGVRILGMESANGRRYSTKAMEQAAELYEGVRLNYDHPDRKTPLAERKFHEFAGELRNCRFDAQKGAVYGDAHILRSHQNAGTLFEAAKRFRNNFGLSHVADGEQKNLDGSPTVVSLNSVESVDVVTRPATNRGLFESVGLDGDEKQTIEEIIEDVDPDTPRRQLLIEFVDSGMLSGTAQVGMPPGAPDENRVKRGMLAGIVAKLMDANDQQLAAVMKILGGGEQQQPGQPPPMQQKPPSQNPFGESEMSQEEKQELEDLRTKHALLEAKTMLLESGREATDEQVRAVAAVPDEMRAKLVESWPQKNAETPQRAPRPSKSAPLRESHEEHQLIESKWKAKVEKARAVV